MRAIRFEALVFFSVFACTGGVSPRAVAERPKVVAQSLDELPSLSPEQRKLLQELQRASSTELSVEVFNRAGTVQRLELSVHAPKGASLVEQAQAFIEANALLWHLKGVSQLKVVSQSAAGDCSNVVFQLQHPSGLAVWNALLTVTLTEEGVVRAVSGKITGEPFEVREPSKMSAKRAITLIADSLRAQGIESSPPDPREEIVDPFFFGDETHQAQRAWLFAPSELRAGETPAWVGAVGQTSASIVFSGPVLSRAYSSECRGSDPTVLPVKVVLDPLTDTPAYVDLTPIGGLPADGKDPVARAYQLLSTEAISRLFGTTAPTVHLRNPKVTPWVGGRALVMFEQFFANRPVEGGYLQVIFNKNQNAETIFARFVYKPNVRRVANVSVSQARGTGNAHYVQAICQGDAKCEAQAQADLAKSPAPATEVVLSSQIFPTAAMPANEARLAWKLEYGQRTLYVNASTDREGAPVVLLDIRKNNDAIPTDIHNLAQNDQLEIRDGVTQPGIVAHPDSMIVSNELNQTDAFYLGLGRNGFDGNGTRMPVRVQWNVPNAMFCPPPCEGMPEPGLYFGVKLIGGDVVGHEFTHALTNATSMLIYDGESGALNESYSDVMGNLISPDTTAPTDWLIGETTGLGTIRDMKNPGAFGQPGHVGVMDGRCLPLDGCVHVWSGVPNRAAVFMSDGAVTSNPHPGFGRPTLGALAFNTLVAMGPSDRFVQQQVRTVSTCNSLVGQRFGGRPLSFDDCDFVAAAFHEVGIDAQLLYGYQKFSTGLFGNRWDFEDHAGERLHNGCQLVDHIIWGMDESGDVLSSDASTGRVIDFTGEWGARISSRGADGDGEDRRVGYHLWSNWYNAGVARPIEVISRPANITRDEDCFYEMPAGPPPPVSHLRRMFSDTRVAHWASFLNGGRGDDAVNNGVLMAPGCTLVGLAGVHYHRTVLEREVVSVLDHGSHGFTVSRAAGASDPADLSTNAHWWHDGFSAIAMRVVYDVLQPEGTDCAVPGATIDVP